MEEKTDMSKIYFVLHILKKY